MFGGPGLSPSLPYPFLFHLFPILHLEVGPLNTARVFEEAL